MVESLALINSSLQNASALLHATHDYIKWQAPLDVKTMSAKQTFKVSCEAMRITVRMTQIIAWLMLHRAVLAGDLTRKEVLSEEYRVLRGQSCLESISETDADLPPRLRELLKESRTLYVRVLRLDDRCRKRSSSLPPLRSRPFSVHRDG